MKPKEGAQPGALDAAKESANGCDATRIYRCSSPDTSSLPVRTVDEVIFEAGEKVPWVIENLLARGAVTEFFGLAKKGGKTTFWCHAIAAGARGENHAGFATEPAKYLYLSEQGNNFAEAPQLGARAVSKPHKHRAVQRCVSRRVGAVN